MGELILIVFRGEAPLFDTMIIATHEVCFFRHGCMSRLNNNAHGDWLLVLGLVSSLSGRGVGSSLNVNTRVTNELLDPLTQF